MRRRDLLRGACVLPLSGCGDGGWHDIDVTGTSPSLAFTMERAPDGARVSQADFRGHVTMLYFGYTFCPDVCPLTLQNVSTVLGRMGRPAGSVRFLFVTVDPARDTLAALGQYLGLFGPNFVGLRGTPDQLELLAQRYRIAYSVTPANASHGIEVTHSSVVYVFDRTGRARLLVPSLSSPQPDIAGVASDLIRVADERPSWRDWVEGLV